MTVLAKASSNLPEREKNTVRLQLVVSSLQLEMTAKQ
jgi:hypothetical protein